ncbi:hypothetical protein [Roseospira marina]|nr:hypothetical protein [Roseospira marina]MBB4314553.1 hypothetical protein [Roseospira marina]MBB5088885.1 hypothetical protein [Roseospira marina]
MPDLLAALLPTVAWIAKLLLIWLVAGLLVGHVIGRVIRFGSGRG